MKKENSLREIANVFFKLGTTAFGGPAVHIALMEKEVVQNRKWMTQAHFLDLVGATNLIPGPNSTELAMHCGQERGGSKGLVVAGLCFILPAVLITGIIAWAYQRYGALPNARPYIYGIKPAIIAVIVALMLTLGRKALKSVELGVIGATAAILVFAGVSEIVVLFAAGAVGMLFKVVTSKNKVNTFSPLLVLASTGITGIPNFKLFLIFLKIGAILYGSGYVLFAFLEDELLTRELITRQQLVDAIAVGQFTPGPVFSSATFIGFQIGGVYGALAATIGIFLPSFLFVAFLNPLIPVLRKSKWMSAFLDSVNIASVAIILAVIIQIGRESIVDWRSVAIAALSFIVTFYFKTLNTAWIILGGAVAGYILSLFTS
jgi:chromate transporter